MVKTFIVHNFLSVAERYEISNIKYWKKETLIELYFFKTNRFVVTKTITFQTIENKTIFRFDKSLFPLLL